MDSKQLTILSISMLSILIISYLPAFSSWRKTLVTYKVESILLISLFIGIFYLGGERTQGSSMVDTTRLIRMVLYISITGIALLRLLSSTSTRWLSAGIIFIIIYSLYGMLSATYSIEPLLTLWKAFEVFTHISVAAVIALQMKRVEDAANLSSLFWLILTFLICTLLAGAVLFHDDAFRPFLDNTGAVASEGAFGSGLRGTFPKLHLNSVTQVGAIIAIISVALLSASDTPGKKYFIILLLSGLTVMILGHSRTSIFAFAFSLLVLGYYLKNKRLRLAIITTSTVIGVAALLSGLITDYILRGQTGEQFSSLTGRLDFWKVVIDAISEKPVIGYGYYAGTRILFGLPGVDNTYLNVLMGGGIVLLAIFIMPILIIMRNMFASRPSQRNINDSSAYKLLWSQTFGLFCVLFLRSLSGPSFDANHFNLILFLLCIINANVLYKFRYSQPTNSSEENVTHDVSDKDNILSRKKQSNLLVTHD